MVTHITAPFSQGKIRSKYDLFIVLVALAGVNRLDTLVLFLPICVWLVFHLGVSRAIKHGLVYGMPLWLLLVFNLIYYGFALPNTYWAKIAGLQYPIWDFAAAGLSYYFGAVQRSPLDLALILFVPFFVFKNRSDWKMRAAALGIASSALYVLCIGGDQMFPRMLGVPVAASLFCFVEILEKNDQKLLAAISGSLLLLLAFSLPWTPLETLKFIDSVSRDESNKYKDRNNFLHGIFVHDFQVSWCQNRFVSKRFDKYEQRRPKEPTQTRSFGFTRAAGRIALVRGPHFKNFDVNGLSDPLLARIPSDKEVFGPGHNPRSIPLGYPETVITGVNAIENEKLAAYWEKLHSVIAAPLWSLERWKAIVELHACDRDPPELAEGDSVTSKEYLAILKKKFSTCSFNQNLVCPDEP